MKFCPKGKNKGGGGSREGRGGRVLGMGPSRIKKTGHFWWG